MTFINKRPTDGPTNYPDMLLDPQYVLTVFTTSDVMTTYDAIQMDEEDEYSDLPSNFEELPEEMRVRLIEAAESVLEDASRQNEDLMEVMRKIMSESKEEPSMLREGDKVTIYLMPLSKGEVEGVATLVHLQDDHAGVYEGHLVETWLVTFTGDARRRSRSVLTNVPATRSVLTDTPHD